MAKPKITARIEGQYSMVNVAVQINGEDTCVFVINPTTATIFDIEYTSLEVTIADFSEIVRIVKKTFTNHLLENSDRVI